MSEPKINPIRICCGERHHGPVCPDGLAMCCHCFKRVPRSRLHVLEEGGGADVSSAPIYEDVCRTCKAREIRWGVRADKARCDTCSDTGRILWMIEGDPNCYQERDAEGTIPCLDCGIDLPRSDR